MLLLAQQLNIAEQLGHIFCGGMGANCQKAVSILAEHLAARRQNGKNLCHSNPHDCITKAMAVQDVDVCKIIKVHGHYSAALLFTQ